MTPDDSLRARLRKLLDEKIPAGGTEADTRFLDADLDELLLEADSIFEAASVGWTMKAGMYQAEMGDVERMTLGQETEQMVALKERQEYALKMADKYAAMAQAQGIGSVVLKLTPPEVL